MNKFLSIIIPRYMETVKEILPLLSSIGGQLGVDFSCVEIIIANDGGNPVRLDDTFLSMFGLDIRQIFLDENRGPGVARQAGLDAATGDYVMFCDADDTLHNVGVLGALIQETRLNAPDILTSEWLEEFVHPQTGEYIYIAHQIENTWVHGKFLRRFFLRKNGIRFHDDLRVHEDSYFLSIAASVSERTIHLPITSYVWKFTPNSITRRNNGIYTFEAYPTFIEACCLSHTRVRDRAPNKMEYKIIQFIMYVYFSLQRPEWRINKHKQYVEESEQTFAKMMVPFWSWLDNAPGDKIAEIYNTERAKNFNGFIEAESVGQWIRRMKNK